MCVYCENILPPTTMVLTATSVLALAATARLFLLSVFGHIFCSERLRPFIPFSFGLLLDFYSISRALFSSEIE